jgi:peptidylprolyl isomerase
MPAPALALAALLAAAPAPAPLPSLDSTRAAPALKDLEARARHSFSGLRFVVLKPGKGELPKAGREVAVKYIGWLTDGNEFDGSYRNGQPIRFRVGQGDVIKGWDEGLADMRPGERRYLIIPPELGYGARGSGPIPPNATLIFDVERVDF